MKTFSELTLTDFLTISDTDLTDAIRKQAIVNGLNIPISMPEALTKSTYAGYTPKTDTFTVWQIATKQGYGGLTTGDTAYLTRQAAEFAMQGMILIKPITDKKYNTIGYELTDDNLEFRIIEKSRITRINFGSASNNCRCRNTWKNNNIVNNCSSTRKWR